MARTRSLQLIGIVAAALIAALGLARPSLAAGESCDPPDPANIVIPAGLACSGFDLKVEGSGTQHLVCRNFTDRNGDVVRNLIAGKGPTLTFTNLSTGATLTTRGNGSIGHTTYNPDGTSETSATGHNVIVLFPTDNPPGPSTTLYIGKIIYTIDADFNWNLRQVGGQAIDICAALGG